MDAGTNVESACSADGIDRWKRWRGCISHQPTEPLFGISICTMMTRNPLGPWDLAASGRRYRWLHNIQSIPSPTRLETNRTPNGSYLPPGPSATSLYDDPLDGVDGLITRWMQGFNEHDTNQTRGCPSTTRPTSAKLGGGVVSGRPTPPANGLSHSVGGFPPS